MSRVPGLTEFEQAAMPFVGELFQCARAVTGDETLAESMVETVYAEGYAAYADKPDGMALRGWLAGILMRHLRRQRRRFTIFPRWAWSAPPADGELLSILRKLPCDEAELILLADVMEFSYREIGQILELPVEQVLDRMAMSRNSFRKQMVGADVYAAVAAGAE